MNALESKLKDIRGTLSKLHLSLTHEQYGDYWSPHIQRFLDLEREVGDDASLAFQLATSVHSIYGGMGSFNDTNYSEATEELKGQLYIDAQEIHRHAWMHLNGSELEIGDADILHKGDKVKLIKGEIISMKPGGAKTLAPKSPLVYTVKKIYPRDFDGMPLYHIKSDSHNWVARHNALNKIT